METNDARFIVRAAALSVGMFLMAASHLYDEPVVQIVGQILRSLFTSTPMAE